MRFQGIPATNTEFIWRRLGAKPGINLGKKSWYLKSYTWCINIKILSFWSIWNGNGEFKFPIGYFEPRLAKFSRFLLQFFTSHIWFAYDAFFHNDPCNHFNHLTFIKSTTTEFNSVRKWFSSTKSTLNFPLETWSVTKEHQICQGNQKSCFFFGIFVHVTLG